jgi:hypothetical protein
VGQDGILRLEFLHLHMQLHRQWGRRFRRALACDYRPNSLFSTSAMLEKSEHGQSIPRLRSESHPRSIRHCRRQNFRLSGWPWYNLSYTVTMKTAVSLPDDLFRLAEATARRLRVSRSELYAKAIAEFLKQQDGSSITKRLNDVYSRCPAKVDPGLHRAQLKSLEKDAW